MINLILIILILIYLFIRFFHNWRPDPWPNNKFQLPKWQIHRGYWIEGLQENTLAAFREAAKRGYQMVELDVQLSKDGIPVVFHDTNLKRLTTHSGNVSDFKASELKVLAHAPTLEEVLSDKEVPLYINIEIKNKSALDQKVAIATANIVKKCHAQSRVLFSSFNPLSLRMVWKKLPQVPRALLATDDTTDPDSRIYLRKMWLGGIAHANMVNLDKKMLTPQLIKRLHERKIPIAAWTVNDLLTSDLLLNKGIISIISDQANEKNRF